jgi:alkylation response protein AidB-like acyl-CoA dehydrogenase
MNFEYTEEQRLLAESVKRFVGRDYGFEARKRILASPTGLSDAVWKEMAAMGLLGLAVPTEHGGFGGGAVDLMSVMEAIGESLVVEPFLSTVIGAQLIARGGTAAQRAALLPAIAEGRVKLAFAHTEAESRYDLARISTRARRDGDGYALEGGKSVVVDGPHADVFVVTARSESGIAVMLVDAQSAGLRQSPAVLLDGHRACDLTLDGVRVSRDALLGGGDDALPLVEEVVDFATALVCAEAVGALRYASDATLEYLKTRKQFGVPIGSFQALQHRMVDMVIECEQARSMASLACARVDARPEAGERKRVVSMAKVKIADACRQVSQESVQLHGGMGMTDELKVSHTFRRLTAIAQQFGDADHHLERIASPSPCPISPSPSPSAA